MHAPATLIYPNHAPIFPPAALVPASRGDAPTTGVKVGETAAARAVLH